MKKELIKKLVEELGNEGYNVEGLLCEEGVVYGDLTVIKWYEYDDVEDDELKDNLIELIREIEEEK